MAYTALDVLQSIGQSRSTCNLVVASKNHRIEIWIIEGIVCRLDGCSEEDLAYFVVRQNPFIFLKPISSEPEKTMNLPLETLVMDIAYRHDDTALHKCSQIKEVIPEKAEKLDLFLSAVDNTISVSMNEYVPSKKIGFKTTSCLKNHHPEKPLPLIFHNNKKTSILIGRSKKCDIFCSHPLISRIHCYITYSHKEKSFFVQDLDSSNGTYLNDKKLLSSSSSAKQNDTVRVGNCSFTLQLQNGLNGNGKSKDKTIKGSKRALNHLDEKKPADPSGTQVNLVQAG
ncbi:MAG: FHA domain-containing protein [Verrucomicrobiota bacterium]